MLLIKLFYEMKRIEKYLLLLLTSIICSCGESSSPKELSLGDFTSALETNEFALGEKEEKIFAMLQAVDGFSIPVNGQKVEIYQFDTSITSGREALERIKKDGFIGRAVTANGNIVIFNNPKHKDWDRIVKIFTEL